MTENGNGHNGTYTAAQFIAAIEDSAGIISTIARRVGCAWNTAKRYIDTYATVKQAYENETQKVLDMAETTILKAIKAEDVGTARWYLSTKGKNRGYVERKQEEQMGKITIEVTGGFRNSD